MIMKFFQKMTKMHQCINACLCALTLASGAAHADARSFPAGTHEVFITAENTVDPHALEKISGVVQDSIKNGFYPGAVILAAQHGKIIYRGVFGNQRIVPTVEPMRFDTIFDVASLTKVIATTTAVMQLAEEGKLDLDAPVAHYWPAFAANGKEEITVRELLTHTSGLPAGIDSPELNDILPEPLRSPNAVSWQGKTAALVKITELHPIAPHGTQFLYSDPNFITLGHLVEIISGLRLDVYASQFIFKPMNMQHTGFLPSAELREQIAPTQMMSGELRWGEAHDPTVHLMGGVAGMAGLFSNAHDIGVFAQTILNQGRISGAEEKYLLEPETVFRMTATQTPPQMEDKRGFGWDIQTKHTCRGNYFAETSFGHTGWTGTSLWIDPVNDAWVVILTSRTHPVPASQNKLLEDRIVIADFVAQALFHS